MLGGLYKGNVSNKMLSFIASVSIFIIIFYLLNCIKALFLFLPLIANKSYNVTTDIIMEKKIVYLKLFQIVLTLTIIWQLISLHQFCGTFTDPKSFLCDIRAGNCENFTLIGKDSKTGEFGSMYKKLHNQFLMNSNTNAPQYQFFDFLVGKLPPVGRHCIPITISPFDWFFEWIGKDRNPLNNGTLFRFSKLFFDALCSLALLGYGIKEMRRSMEEYKAVVYWYAFTFVYVWGYSVVHSFKLLFHWNEFWTCVNFQPDQTNVPFVTLVVSVVLVCSSIFEIILHKFVLNDVVDTKSAIVFIDQQHQQKKKNGSACAIE